MAVAIEKLPAPFLTFDGINNIRDLGGYPVESKDGGPRKVVRSNVLFRSGDPNRAPLETVIKLRSDAGIVTVYDFRSMDGILGSGGGEVVLRNFNKNRQEAGIDRIWAPVIDDDKTSPEEVAERLMAFMKEGPEGYVEQFMGYLRTGYPSFHRLIMHLSKLRPQATGPDAGEPQGVLFHCSSGNNRTGAYSAAMLYLLGVPRQVIADEYGLGEIGSAKTRGGMASRLKARILKAGGFNGDEKAITQDMLDRLTCSRPENMLAFLDAIDKEWGTIENYSKTVLRMTDEDIARFRSAMTVDAPSQ